MTEDTMRKKYPSDITREQFERIEPVLEKARKRTKPRTVELYDVFCGVLYVLKSGCQWRMLPDDLPTWETCYAYWHKWATTRDGDHSLLEVALKKCGWRSSTRPWAARTNNLLNR